MSDTVRIGVIGAKPDQGWASVSHIPAIAATPGLQLAAVAARSQDSADAAARGFGVAKAYGSTDDLIADPDIDLVAVVTSVPGHHDLILASLAAGKHVITEWPVGISTAQTQEILDAARAAGVRTAVGLQARMNPAVGHAMHLLRTGALGRVVDATVYSATAAFGAVIAAGDVYLEKPETAMNLVTIQASHTMDLAAVMVGGLDSLSALTTVRYPQVAVAGQDRTVERTLADHVLVNARTTAGGALSVQVVGGRPADGQGGRSRPALPGHDRRGHVPSPCLALFSDPATRRSSPGSGRRGQRAAAAGTEAGVASARSRPTSPTSQAWTRSSSH